MANILIIDDDPSICRTLSAAVERMDYGVRCAATLEEGLRLVSEGAYDVVLLDVTLPDGNGLDAIPEIRGSAASPEVIIITGIGDPDGAELAIKSGAWDYLQKPPSLKDVNLHLGRAIAYRKEKHARKRQRVIDRSGMIGNSPEINDCLELVLQSTLSDAPVLLTGETGTGKEVFANLIHRNSPRRKGEFVVVDCAALPPTLVESTLFGYVEGAYTSANRTQQGLVKHADGGTLFLDEIGELPLSSQKAFLRVIQEHRFRPVGGKQEVKSNIRLVAATNRDLEQMVREKRFRQDLLFRIRSMVIDLPPLRNRGEDIKEIAYHHMARLCGQYGLGTKRFSPEFTRALMLYPWPGNVRELMNCIENAVTSAGQEPELIPRHLPPGVRIELARASLQSVPGTEADAVQPAPLIPFKDFRDSAVSAAEKQYLKRLMSDTGHNIRQACEVAHLSRPRLYALLKKHGMTRSRQGP